MRSPVGLKEKEKILQNAFRSCQNTLCLRGQHLHHIPTSIFLWPFPQNLRILDLSYNEISLLPEEIGVLCNLEELYVNHNELKSFPKNVQNLGYLRKLGLAHNKLTEITFSLKELTSLMWLNVSGNFIEVIPPQLFCMPSLLHFYFLHNPVENIPKEIRTESVAFLREYFGVCVENIAVKTNQSSMSEESQKKKSIAAKVKSKSMCCKQLFFTPEKRYEKTVHKDNDTNTINSKGEDTIHVKGENNLKKTGLMANFNGSSFENNTKEERNNILTHLLKSQFEQRQLVRDLEERTKLKLELRKLNIEFLQHRRLQKQDLMPVRRRRLSEPFSLDSGNPSQQRRRRHTMTSEYGTCSESLVQNTSIGSYHVLDKKLTPDTILLPINDGSVSYSTDGDYSLSCCEISDDDAVDDSSATDNPDRRRHISHGDICVIIPEENLSGHFQWEFDLEIVEDLSYGPPISGRQAVASEVLMMGPHGAKFYTSDPAIISLPYDVRAGHKDKVFCVCSDTGFGERPNWVEMKSEEYSVFDGHVEIRALHFSLFAIIVQKGYPEAHKTIKKGIGGCLYVEEVPGVEINFPETSLLYDIEASVKVLYADKPYDVDHSNTKAMALATPVVEVGPHGCQFDPQSEEHVTVRLPIPNGKEIFDQFGDRRLTFWSSSTTGQTPLHWQQFTPKYFYIDKEDPKLYSVYFSVEHFTFFRVLWDIIDAVLWEAKLGASHFFPEFQFYISCQALMSELGDDGLRFGLCVICYRFGKSIEGIGNFPFTVGNHPPKMIKKGKLTIRLDSKLFQADSELGERSLTKDEDFTGRPCVIQFACCFTGPIPGHGTFGKVSVLQAMENISDIQSVFSFNLDKPRDTMEQQSSSLAWEVKLSKELAGLLSIQAERDMGDEVWQDLAESIGYTPAEITKLSTSDEPLQELIAHYKRRGGQAERFIAALYRIGQPHLPPSGSRNKCQQNTEEGETAVKSSSSNNHQMCPCVKKNMRKRKFTEEVVEDKLNELAGKLLDKWKQMARMLRMSESKIREIEVNFKQEGVREQAIQMLLAFRDLYPDKCTLNVLSSALCKIGLGYVARQYCFAAELG